MRCFDLQTPVNVKIARRYKDNIEVVWGDLRRTEDVAVAVRDQDIVIHLAFVIPKMSHTGVESEARPDWARAINVGGTRTLIEAIQAMPRPARLIFSSSVHVYGPPQESRPPRTASDPVEPTEHYSRHKIECEQMIRASGLEWSIFRFAAALPLLIRLDRGCLTCRWRTAWNMCTRAMWAWRWRTRCRARRFGGKLLLIGGGPRCQYHFREIVGMILNEMGVGMLPERAFGLKPFATDWMDTSESQRLLRYQRRDLRDYVREMKQKLGFRLALIWMFRPLVRAWLLRKSPYYARG